MCTKRIFHAGLCLLSLHLTYAQPTGHAPDTPMGRVAEELDLGGDRLEISSGAYDWASVSGVYELFPRLVAIGAANDPTATIPPSLIPALEQLPDWLGLNQVLASGRSTRLSAGGYVSRSVKLIQPDATGLAWQLHPQSVDLNQEAAKLPPTTAAILRVGFNAPVLMRLSLQKLSQLGVPADDIREIHEALNANPKLTRAILQACAGGVTLGITLNAETPWPMPFPGMAPLPEPGVVVMVPDAEGQLGNLLAEFLQEEAMVDPTQLTFEDIDVIVISLPIPSPTPVALSLAHVDGRLVLTSNPQLMESVIARRNGEGASPLLESLHPAFPRQITTAWVHSPLFRETLETVAALSLQMAPFEMEMAHENAQALRENMLALYRNFDLQVVSEVRGDLRQSVMLHSQPMVTGLPLQTQLTYAPATIGLLSAIALPGFVRARESAQHNSHINHLRMIDAAKDQWAIETNQMTGAQPTAADINEYFRHGFPTCPQGGVYEIRAVGESPVYRRGDTVITLGY